MRKVMQGIIVAMTIAIALTVQAADVPPYINYQGLLVKDGKPVNGSKHIKFTFCDSTGAALTQIFEYDVTIVDGVFNKNIGPLSIPEIRKFAENNEVFVQLEVDGTKFSPQQIISTGYSLRSQIAATVDDNAITTEKIALQAVERTDIKDLEVIESKLGVDSVTRTKIKNGEVTAEKLAEGAVPSSTPPGTVVMWAGISAPAGWKYCNGESLSKIDYPELFSKIQYTFGGTGEYFNIPNLKDKFIVGGGPGTSYGLGKTGGTDNISDYVHPVSLTIVSSGSLNHVFISVDNHQHKLPFTHNLYGFAWTDQFRTQWGEWEVPGEPWGSVSVENNNFVVRKRFDLTSPDNAFTPTITERTMSHAHSHTATVTGGLGGGHDNRPSYFALAYIIKL
jgi:hypothetical protein